MKGPQWTSSIITYFFNENKLETINETINRCGKDTIHTVPNGRVKSGTLLELAAYYGKIENVKYLESKNIPFDRETVMRLSISTYFIESFLYFLFKGFQVPSHVDYSVAINRDDEYESIAREKFWLLLLYSKNPEALIDFIPMSIYESIKMVKSIEKGFNNSFPNVISAYIRTYTPNYLFNKERIAKQQRIIREITAKLLNQEDASALEAFCLEILSLRAFTMEQNGNYSDFSCLLCESMAGINASMDLLQRKSNEVLNNPTSNVIINAAVLCYYQNRRNECLQFFIELNERIVQIQKIHEEEFAIIKKSKEFINEIRLIHEKEFYPKFIKSFAIIQEQLDNINLQKNFSQFSSKFIGIELTTSQCNINPIPYAQYSTTVSQLMWNRIPLMDRSRFIGYFNKLESYTKETTKYKEIMSNTQGVDQLCLKCRYYVSDVICPNCQRLNRICKGCVGKQLHCEHCKHSTSSPIIIKKAYYIK